MGYRDRTLRDRIRITLSTAPLVVSSLLFGVATAAEAQSRPLGTSYEGYHGATTCEHVVGWVWDPGRPDVTIHVDVFHADSFLVRLPADLHRPDLEEAGIGNAAHGFAYTLPPSVREAGTGQIEVRVAVAGLPLHRTPQSVPCPAYEAASTGSPAAATGAAAESRGATYGSKRLEARRIPGGTSISLDGRPTEEAWDDASFVTDFLQRGADRGYPRDEGMAVAFLYDDDALYVAARMQNAGEGRARTQLVRRDDAGNLERLLVSFDTYRDRRTAHTFGITTAGVRLDYYHPVDDEGHQDPSFDPVWEGRTAVEGDGWTAELRIPFSQLRFPRGEGSSWGVNIRRFDPATYLNMYWVVIPVNETGWASRFGELAGLEAVGQGRRLEIRPYVLGGLTLEQGGSGVTEGTSTRLGGDAKVGLAPNLTLDVTVNPDFGQIEADPAEVNLSQFETAVSERRPFFQEGAQLFQGGGPRYFYSRRVGGVPWSVRQRNLLNVQATSNIRGAAKLTGRLNSGLSIGAMAAMTSAASGELFADGASAPVVDEIAPRTGFAVARLQQELGSGGSWAGLLLTGLRRDLAPDGYLASVLARDAMSGGIDWHLRLNEGHHVVTGWAGFSHIRGDSAAVVRIQRSGAHYFQRPDARHLQVDSGATSLAGYTGGITVAKRGGERWLWDLGASVESPGFEIRDAGAFDSADDLDAFANLRFRHLRPNGVFRNMNLTLSTSAGWNLDGVRRASSASLFGHLTWLNFWRTYLQIGTHLPALSDELTRGGPLMATPLVVTGSGGLSNSFSAPIQWSLDANGYRDALGGWSLAGSASLSLPLSSHLLLSLTPGYSRSDGVRQFLTSLPDGGEATFGRRYLFALLDRREIYSQLRLDASPMADLTLELYVEPFVSSGRYYQPGELAAASTDRIRVYGTDGTTVATGPDGELVVDDAGSTVTVWNHDFVVRSFRSNAVLRWEWRRGSRLSLIWQQNRWAWNQIPRGVDPAGLWDATADPGENILTLKVSYWHGID